MMMMMMNRKQVFIVASLLIGTKIVGTSETSEATIGVNKPENEIINLRLELEDMLNQHDEDLKHHKENLKHHKENLKHDIEELKEEPDNQFVDQTNSFSYRGDILDLARDQKIKSNNIAITRGLSNGWPRWRMSNYSQPNNISRGSSLDSIDEESTDIGVSSNSQSLHSIPWDEVNKGYKSEREYDSHSSDELEPADTINSNRPANELSQKSQTDSPNTSWLGENWKGIGVGIGVGIVALLIIQGIAVMTNENTKTTPKSEKAKKKKEASAAKIK